MHDVFTSCEHAHSYEQVLARTLAVDYHIPRRPRVSNECVHLMSQLLVKDPNGRLTPAGIMKHPWFRHNLPPGVGDLNDKCLRMKVRTHHAVRIGAQVAARFKSPGGVAHVCQCTSEIMWLRSALSQS